MSSRLSITSYVILGMVALRGPSASYDLKRAIGRSVGYFWSFPHSQLYDEPRRLESAGLLHADADPSGRRRRVYSITETGLEALREWLRDPTAEVFQVRDDGELKLFFSEFGDVGQVAALARGKVEFHGRRIEAYDLMRRTYSSRRELASTRWVALDLAIGVERAALEFWQHLAETGVAPVARPSTRKQTTSAVPEETTAAGSKRR
jgi:PadR family transcriptional regulator, regulatory protein AphA